MVLPGSMNLTDEVTVAVINYGAFNPFERTGGALADGASVNSFTFNGVEVSDLGEPIVLALPLPSSRRRRELFAWNASSFGSKDFAESYSTDCGGENVTRLEAAYTTQDLARAQYCGTEHLLVNQTKVVSYLEPPKNGSKSVWCSSIEAWHYLDCEGRRGVINFTCPVYYPVSTCTFWDTGSSSWSSEGCTYWRTDEVNGVAYCNCTHLTSFTAGQGKSVTSSTATFASTTRSIEDLDGKAVLQNIGILISLVALWAAAGVLYLYDTMRRRFELMHEILSDEAYAQYLTLDKKMFVVKPKASLPNSSLFDGPESTMTALRRVLGNSRDQSGEELREVERPKAGLLYSTEVADMFSQEHATTMIDMEARQLTGMLKKKSKTLRGWFNAMSEENHVVALFNPESYRRVVFTKRSVFLLVARHQERISVSRCEDHSPGRRRASPNSAA
jgi:hypothetical protein